MSFNIRFQLFSQSFVISVNVLKVSQSAIITPINREIPDKQRDCRPDWQRVDQLLPVDFILCQRILVIDELLQSWNI